MGSSFRSRLRAGETLLGTMVTLPSAASAEVLANCGFDWLMIDCEHGPLEIRDVVAILQAVGDRVACVVRVPSGDEVSIKKVLDVGATGIVVPQVNTAEQARDVVRYSRYAPQGQRGVGIARAHQYGLEFNEYLQAANDSIAVIVQAEHIEAVNNIEQIVDVDGIDAVYLGPYDLSASLGRMGQINDAAVVDAIQRVTRTCSSAGMPLGYFGVDSAAVEPYIQRGYTLITVGLDTMLLADAAKQAVEQLR